MIINVRGTHGTGKTTIVRAVMERYTHRKTLYQDGRRIPIGYVCTMKGRRPLFVPGSYEHPITGGCDNIPKLDWIYAPIYMYAKKRYDILYEGIVAQHSTPNIVELFETGYDMRIVVLDLPFKRALRGIHARRKLRGETRPFNPINAINEARAIINSSERLRAMGVPVIYPKTRRAARARTLSLLGLV